MLLSVFGFRSAAKFSYAFCQTTRRLRATAVYQVWSFLVKRNLRFLGARRECISLAAV